MSGRDKGKGEGLIEYNSIIIAWTKDLTFFTVSSILSL